MRCPRLLPQSQNLHRTATRRYLQTETPLMPLMPASQSDLDLLMSRIDEINAKTDLPLPSSDIDALISYHRRARALKASGVKPSRAKANLADILGPIVPKPQPSTTPKLNIKF